MVALGWTPPRAFFFAVAGDRKKKPLDFVAAM